LGENSTWCGTGDGMEEIMCETEKLQVEKRA